MKRFTADVAKVGRLLNGIRIADGAILPQQRVPVTLNFDASRIIGFANVHVDGSADIELQHDVETPSDVTIGYRETQSHMEGDVRVVDAFRRRHHRPDSGCARIDRYG